MLRVLPRVRQHRPICIGIAGTRKDSALALPAWSAVRYRIGPVGQLLEKVVTSALSLEDYGYFGASWLWLRGRDCGAGGCWLPPPDRLCFLPGRLLRDGRRLPRRPGQAGPGAVRRGGAARSAHREGEGRPYLCSHGGADTSVLPGRFALTAADHIITNYSNTVVQ